MTGLWCPFCGGLRSAYELTRLNLSAALHDNLIVVAAAPIVLVLWLDAIIRSHRGRPRRQFSRSVVVASVLAVVVFGVVRNLPFAVALRGGS
jgi:hypothetical protein